MDLSEALRVLGKTEFREVLAEAILENKNRLPTEKACLVGGWPRNEEIVAVNGDHESPEAVFADVVVSFDEVLNPSCGTQPNHIPPTLAYRVVIDKGTGTAALKAIDSDTPEELRKAICPCPKQAVVQRRRQKQCPLTSADVQMVRSTTLLISLRRRSRR